MEAIKTAKDGRQYTVINGKAVFIKGSKPVVKSVVEMAPALVTPIADTKGIACGNCKGKHTSIQDVRNCFKVKPVNMKGIACGKCKSKHSTVQEVRACFGVRS
jgi:hypothetical protein